MANTPQISPPFLCSTSRNRRDLMIPRFQKFVVPFTPLALPGLGFWYDASQITGLSDDDEITTWPDLSGNSNDATNSSSSSGPTFKTSILNGKPVARFDGASNYLTLGTNFTGGDGSYMFAVVNYSGGSADDTVVISAQKVALYSCHPSSYWGTYINTFNIDSGVSLISSGYALLTLIIPSSSDIKMYTNGASVYDYTDEHSWPTRGNSAIGADATGVQFHNGDIAELFGGVGTITTDILTAVNGYISDKYAIF